MDLGSGVRGRLTLPRHTPADNLGTPMIRRLTIEDILNQFAPLPTSLSSPELVPSTEPSIVPESSMEVGYLTHGRKIYTLGDGYTPLYNGTKRHINAIIAVTPPPLNLSAGSPEPMLLAVHGFFVTPPRNNSLALRFLKIPVYLSRLFNFDVVGRRLNNLLIDAKAQEKVVEPAILIDCTYHPYARLLRKKILKCVHLRWAGVPVTVLIGNKGVDWGFGTPSVNKERQRRNQKRKWWRTWVTSQHAGKFEEA
ncbi:hypothetical protein O1611_g3895 [Lasiodiplodia mahajangana]|uniref:Uncharacterized protein n=1 Tax=Lasiodiplodia mahajangana TaxID=1108764 RepID=A0ACC2JQU7_9PEZI|nr:hypothetical protein O1611_g3895 [Lasiodiplodia mahajangana]